MSQLQSQSNEMAVEPLQTHKLDDRKRQRVLGMIAMGSSRRQAAKMVGVHAATIGRAVARDPKFAEDMREAEMLGRNRPLRAMYDAVDKHWRAAAWMLERRCPEEFARRKPETYALRDVREIVDRLLEEVLPLLADDAQREQISDAADTLIESLEKPPVPEPVNPLLEWAQMDAEVEQFKREEEEKAQALRREEFQRQWQHREQPTAKHDPLQEDNNKANRKK